jgi:hypothetical protein
MLGSYVNSVFEEKALGTYRYAYSGRLLVGRIAGGVPSNDRVVEGWLRKKLGVPEERLLQEEIAKVMIARQDEGKQISKESAVDEVLAKANVNGFKKDPKTGVLYIEGRQLKAAMKEAVSVAVAAGNIKATGWGETKKWVTNFFPEHVFVEEDELYLGQLVDERDPNSRIRPVTEPSGVSQRFVQTRFGSSITYEEYVDNAVVDFNLIADFLFTADQWAQFWLTGQQQGIGASRSQGFGRYKVISWVQTRNEARPVKPEADKPAPVKKATKKATAAAAAGTEGVEE